MTKDLVRDKDVPPLYSCSNVRSFFSPRIYNPDYYYSINDSCTHPCILNNSLKRIMGTINRYNKTRRS